jgi:hypothetical protein
MSPLSMKDKKYLDIRQSDAVSFYSKLGTHQGDIRHIFPEILH